MMTQDNDVMDYLEAKRLVWKSETLRATASRLKQHSPCLDAAQVYSNMIKQGYRPYYIKICFISLASFMDWMIAQGRASYNPYREWMQANNHLFRNAYEDKYATISWEEFLDEYQAADSETKKVLALMGFAGCRLSEIYTFDGSTVRGKGSKLRRCYLPVDVIPGPIKLSPTQIRRRLRYNPHAYRKLAADKWLRSGIDLKTVQVLLGHTSLTSTQRYLRPLEQDALKARLEGIWRKESSQKTTVEYALVAESGAL